MNPFNTRMYPSGHYGFGTASAAALGAKFSLDQAYQNRYNSVLTKIIVFAGDGASTTSAMAPSTMPWARISTSPG